MHIKFYSRNAYIRGCQRLTRSVRKLYIVKLANKFKKLRELRVKLAV